MFSLLHFLASHPRNADMLKRALRGDTDARRLFSFLGVTPTHLADIDDGAIARRSAALSVPRTVDVTVNLRPESADMTTPASCEHRLAEAEDEIRALRDRAESAEAASEHGPLTDLLLITGRKVEAFCLPKAPEEWRYGVSVDGYLHTHGATPREALIRMRDQVRERLAEKAETTAPEVIVLGPWRNENGVMRREKLTDPWKGFAFMHAYPATPKGAWSCIRPGSAHAADQTYQDIGGIPAADDWARDRYALIDAEPGSLEGSLPRFRRWWTGICAYWQTDSTPSDVQVTVLEKSRQDAPGWEIVRWLDVGETITLAHGPQTGEEGKRYALAAAHALGLTGGGE